MCPHLWLVCRETQVSDASWPVLAQLPLEWLDVSSTNIKCASWPEGAVQAGLRCGLMVRPSAPKP